MSWVTEWQEQIRESENFEPRGVLCAHCGHTAGWHSFSECRHEAYDAGTESWMRCECNGWRESDA